MERVLTKKEGCLVVIQNELNADKLSVNRMGKWLALLAGRLGCDINLTLQQNLDRLAPKRPKAQDDICLQHIHVALDLLDRWRDYHPYTATNRHFLSPLDYFFTLVQQG
ncbi:hypothetical protein NDU88_001056 [Pleurodeles waltl]|uniref:Uncharacterized protein n=1 Tax=Pleurodeles waltl TaxID=8319 RepID=A0AAV7PBF0_PLEWA|nr:hypothetical protein NDU88_001056 [Pleurodeles waltl]